MKILFALLCLAISAEAKTPARSTKPAPTPAPRVVFTEPDPLPESVPMARQLTAQEDLELRDWITGMMKEGQLAKDENAGLKLELKTTTTELGGVMVKLGEAETRLVKVQTAFDAERAAKEKAQAEKELEHKAKLAAEEKEKVAEAHTSRIKSWLGVALGALLALVAEYILAQFTLPPGLAGYFIWIRVAAPIAAFGLGWLIVARCV